MHRIECPECHTRYRAASPKAQAQLQCAKCGTIFVGSSVEIDDDSPVEDLASSMSQLAGAGSHATATSHRRPVVRTQGKPWIVISAAVAAVAVIVLVGWLIVSWDDVKVTVGDEEAATMSKKEATERKAAEDAKRIKAAKARADARAAGPSDPAPPVRPAAPAKPPKLKAGDPNINVDGAIIVPRTSLAGAGNVFGQARNDYPGGAAAFTLNCMLITKDNRAKKLTPVLFKAVPTGENIHYSFRFDNIPEDAMDTLKAHVWAEPGRTRHDPKALAWMVEAERTSGGGGKSVWTGRAKNPFPREAMDVEVICDFYERGPGGQWVHGGSATTQLKYAKNLTPGKSERFELIYVSGMRADRANAVECRAVGRSR